VLNYKNERKKKERKSEGKKEKESGEYKIKNRKK